MLHYSQVRYLYKLLQTMDEDLPATNDPNADPPAEQDHQFDEEALP